ncbi:MAG: chitobiase/beta-hexosaminidase C-terminal domain-containing protein, partial [Verrucomicrobiales bacterium]|nr:chitobiase/beta-hexosaminidase C-terminal domain-containing protein [Verrucomicrobiales bacterium]
MNKTTFLSLATALLLPWAASAQPTVDFVLTNGIVEPHSIAVVGESKFFITDSATHRLLVFDSDNGLLSVAAGVGGKSGSTNGPGFLARFVSPKGIVAARGGLVVADSGNHMLRFLTTTGSVSDVSTFAGTVGQPGLVDGPANAARFNNPVGLAADAAGNIYVADAKNNAIRKIDLNNIVSTISTDFFEPNALALGDNGQIFVADTRNNAIKVIGPGNVVSLLAGNAAKVAGTNDSYFATEALFNAPNSLLWIGGSTGLLVSDTGNHTLRRVYFNQVVADYFPDLGYSVETYSGIPRQAGFVDGPLATAKFNSPVGLSKDSEGGLFIADLGNHALRRIQTTPKLPKIKNPIVGYVIFVTDERTGEIVSHLVPFTDAVFNNVPILAVLAEPGTESFYTEDATPGLFAPDTIPAPSSGGNGSQSPPPYADGSHFDEVRPLELGLRPDTTIKVVSTSEGRRPSDIVQARVQFKAAIPAIVGDNPASFQVTSATAEAVIWYTLDGSIPTNQPPSIDAATATINIITNSPFTFRARAFRDGFKPSEVVSKTFSPTEFKANRISFGFERGEASSQFV